MTPLRYVPNSIPIPLLVMFHFPRSKTKHTSIQKLVHKLLNSTFHKSQRSNHPNVYQLNKPQLSKIIWAPKTWETLRCPTEMVTFLLPLSWAGNEFPKVLLITLPGTPATPHERWIVKWEYWQHTMFLPPNTVINSSSSYNVLTLPKSVPFQNPRLFYIWLCRWHYFYLNDFPAPPHHVSHTYLSTLPNPISNYTTD